MSLAISTNSWHYKLHLCVRNAWGISGRPPRSLCPYFHTTLWGSLLTVIAFPIVALGWLACKTVRTLYKMGQSGGALGWFADMVDNKRNFSTSLDDAPKDFKRAFMQAGIAWFLWACFMLIIGAVSVGVVVFLLFGGIRILPDIPGYLWTALNYVGWAWVHFCGFMGWMLTAIGIGIADAAVWCWDAAIVPAASWVWAGLSDGAMWVAVVRWAATIAFWLLGPSIAAMVLCYIFSRKPFEPFWQWAEMKANGYMAAREKRIREQVIRSNMKLVVVPKGMSYVEFMKQRRREMIAMEDAREQEEYRRRKARQDRREARAEWLNAIGDGIATFFVLIGGIFVALWKGMLALYSREAYEVNPETGIRRPVQVLGPIGVLWKFLVNLKKGLCPMLDFVDDDNLTNEPPKPPTKPKVDLA